MAWAKAGPGRPPGSRGKLQLERERLAAKGKIAIEALDLTPMEVMARKMAGDPTIDESMFQAAIALAPYVHDASR
jgi:hypothetical protein